MYFDQESSRGEGEVEPAIDNLGACDQHLTERKEIGSNRKQREREMCM